MNLAWAKKKVASMARVLNSTPTTLTDSVAKGYLSVYKEFEDGSKELVLDNDPNIIMYDARRRHLAFLHDITAPRELLDSFRVGTGGAVGSDLGGNTNIKIIAPDPSRNDLYQPIALVNNDEIQIVVSDPAIDEVYLQILFTLSQQEANGTFINECGLFKDSGLMFNHKTFASIPKSDNFSLIFDWKIVYV